VPALFVLQRRDILPPLPQYVAQAPENRAESLKNYTQTPVFRRLVPLNRAKLSPTFQISWMKYRIREI